jgi:hypothetical protein
MTPRFDSPVSELGRSTQSIPSASRTALLDDSTGSDGAFRIPICVGDAVHVVDGTAFQAPRHRLEPRLQHVARRNRTAAEPITFEVKYQIKQFR